MWASAPLWHPCGSVDPRSGLWTQERCRVSRPRSGGLNAGIPADPAGSDTARLPLLGATTRCGAAAGDGRRAGGSEAAGLGQRWPLLGGDSGAGDIGAGRTHPGSAARGGGAPGARGTAPGRAAAPSRPARGGAWRLHPFSVPVPSVPGSLCHVMPAPPRGSRDAGSAHVPRGSAGLRPVGATWGESAVGGVGELVRAPPAGTPLPTHRVPPQVPAAFGLAGAGVGASLLDVRGRGFGVGQGRSWRVLCTWS